jgi:toxin CptA
MKSATPVAFDYKPSRWLLAAVVLMCALALAGITWSGVPQWIKFFSAILAAVCAGFALGRFLRPRVRRAAWQQAGHWRVTDADGREFTAELTRGVARGAWIVLGLRRGDGKDLALVLGPDNCSADTRRQLRVRLARVEGVA